MINKTDKSLARVTQINKIRNERGDITNDTTEYKIL